MKYTINFSCGHAEETELVGRYADRQKRIAYLEQSGKCSQCYGAELAVKKAAEKTAEQANLAADAAARPMLTGSDKQIAWAYKIRKQKMSEIESGRVAAEARLPEEIAVKFLTAYEKLNNQTVASWWIENHEITGKKLMNEMAKG
jgi:hypothetical protein